jgi:hypothetical protein
MRRDAMSGGKFNRQLTINGGRLSPAGPMELDPGETAVRLDVWVLQEDNAACVAVQRDFPDPNNWTANPDLKDYTGQFAAGPATAMALLLSRTAGGQTEAYQWTQGILLV